MRGGSGKVEAGRGRLDDRFDLRQPGQRLDARLRLTRLAGLVAEAVDERLDVRPFGRDVLGGAGNAASRVRCGCGRIRRSRRGSATVCRDRGGRSPPPRGPAGRDRARPAARRRGSGRASPPARASPPGPGGWSARRAAAGRGWRTVRWPARRACASRRRTRPPDAPGRPRRSRGRPGWSAARAGAASAPIARSRSWISARRSGAAVSASASRDRRSGSPCRTVSVRVSGPSGACWRTVASRARVARRMSPPSGASSPAMARSRVVLPAPLRPTRPMRRPGSTVRSAPSSSVRPPRRMVRLEMTRSDMGRRDRTGWGARSREAAASDADRGFIWQGDRVKPWDCPEVAVRRGTGHALGGCRAGGLLRENANSRFCAGGGTGSGFKGLIREYAGSGLCAGGAVGSGFKGSIRENADSRFCAGGGAGSGFKGLIRQNADFGFCVGGGAGSGFTGLIRENADWGFCAGGGVGSGFKGLIRENADSGFCAGGGVGSGFKGLIRENADSGFCADGGTARGSEG